MDATNSAPIYDLLIADAAPPAPPASTRPESTRRDATQSEPTAGEDGGASP